MHCLYYCFDNKVCFSQQFRDNKQIYAKIIFVVELFQMKIDYQQSINLIS
ncbi:hypothetical protein pb186bvf_002350 [Paramecium bursaria]